MLVVCVGGVCVCVAYVCVCVFCCMLCVHNFVVRSSKSARLLHSKPYLWEGIVLNFAYTFLLCQFLLMSLGCIQDIIQATFFSLHFQASIASASQNKT